MAEIAAVNQVIIKADDLTGPAFSSAIGNVTKLGSAAAEMKNALGVIVGSAAVAGVIAFGLHAIEAAEQMERFSLIVGTTAEKFSMLVPSARLSGTELETVAHAADKFSKSMATALDPTSKTGAALEAIGISAKRSAEFLKDPVAGMKDVADALKNFADDGNKAAIVMQLFGKSGAELLPFLKELAKQQELTATMTNEQARAAKELTDAWRLMQLHGALLKQNIVSEVVPSLTALLDGFVKATTGSDSLKSKIKELTSSGEIASWAQRAAIAIATMVDGAVNLYNGLKTLLMTAVLPVIEGFRTLATVGYGVGQILSGNLAEGWATIKQVGTNIKDTFTAIRDQWAVQPSTKFQDAVADSIIKLQLHAGATKDAAKPHADFQAALAKTGTVAVDLTKALDAYQKALAAVAKASVDAQAKLELQAIANWQAEIKRQYDRGVLDFQHYWDAKTALEKTALAVQESALQADVDIQERLVGSLQAVINNIDPSKFKTTAEYEKAVTDESAKLLTAFAGLIKAQGDLNVVQKKGVEIGKGYIEALIAESNGHPKKIHALDDEIAKRIDENAAIGLTQSQVIALNIARVEELRANADLSGPEGAALLTFYDDQIDRLHKLADATSAGENKARLVAGWQDLFKSAADAGAKFITDFVQHGSSAFKNLWNDFKTWALESLAKIAAQKIIVSIAGSIGLGGTATNALAGSNPLGSILSGGGGLGNASSLGGAASTVAGWYGGTAAGAATIGAGTGEAISGFAVAAEGFAGVSAGLTAALAAVPVYGWIALAALAAYAVISSNKEPAQVKGQFGVSAGTTGFEDNAFTASAFGNLGFIDANTQQFSGEAAKAFNKIVSGALDVFSGSMSETQKTRFASILQSTTFPVMEGTFTTEDFINKYGGQVLQQVVVAAFNVLDPAFASVVANFKGTAAEVATFGGTLLVLYDASKYFSDGFKENIVGALADATQETANKVLAFVAVVALFGDSIAGLGPELEALDPANMIAFVDALGGAAKMAASFAYLGANFLTTADRLAQSTALLTSDFTNLGVTIPQTHAEFLALLSSFDLTTAAGRDMYASVLALANLFVAVHGTADQAAQAVTGLTTSAAAATTQITELSNAIDPSTNPYMQFRLHLQEYVDNFLSQIAALTSQMANADVGAKLGAQILMIGQKIASVTAQMSAASAAGDFFSVDTFTQELGLLNQANSQMVAQLAEFTTLTAQYGSAIAGQLIDLETRYHDQQKALAGNNEALAFLATRFNNDWAAIINGTAAGVGGTISALQKIADYLKSLQVGNISTLTPMQKLATASAAFDAEYAKALGGDQGALGDVTQFADTYLKLARDAFASSKQYTDIFNQVTGELGNLAGTTPTGQPIQFATSADIKTLTAELIAAIAALADASTTDTADMTSAVVQAKVAIVDAINSGLK